MAKYTVTLKTLIDENIPFWTFEEIVASYYDEYFTAEKWQSLKQLFNVKYMYNEIGQETVELFSHYLMRSFMERIETYKKMLSVVTNELQGEMLNNGEIKQDNFVINEDLPFTELDNYTHATSKSTQNNTGTSRTNQTKADLFENFYKKYRDIDDEFLEGFYNCFMLIY